MSTLIKEAATATRTGPGRVMLTLITPGVGSSGEYTPDVLEQAATDVVFPRGTQSHINHDTTLERMERPEGDLRNLAMVTVENAVWQPDWVDPETGVKGRLAAESRVSSAWRDFVEEFGEFIGASIVASADIKETASGRVVEKLFPSKFNRVDLVTAAGRGGKISEVLEAARVIEARSIVAEATANETRQLILAALKAAHGDEGTWVWIRDYDDAKVWFEVESDGSFKIYEQSWALSNGAVTLGEGRIEVRSTTSYVPVTNTTEALRTVTKTTPPDPAGETPNQEEANMATIDDKELADLRESASRATTAEAALKTANEERAAESKAARKDKAEAIVKEAFGDDTPAFFLTVAALLAESKDFDADKLRTDATEAAAKIAVDNGAGTPRGVGETGKVTESGKTFTPDMIVDALHGKAA